MGQNIGGITAMKKHIQGVIFPLRSMASLFRCHISWPWLMFLGSKVGTDIHGAVSQGRMTGNLELRAENSSF